MEKDDQNTSKMSATKQRRCWADESEDVCSPELDPIKPNYATEVVEEQKFNLEETVFGIDVWGAPPTVSEDAIKHYFTSFGVEVISVVRRRRKTNGEECLHLKLPTDESNRKALQMNGSTLNKTIDVNRTMIQVKVEDSSGLMVDIPSGQRNNNNNNSSGNSYGNNHHGGHGGGNNHHGNQSSHSN